MNIKIMFNSNIKEINLDNMIVFSHKIDKVTSDN